MEFRVGDSAGKIQVATTTMADILEKFEATKYMPLICKIDIEGGKSDLFRANDAWVDQFPRTSRLASTGNKQFNKLLERDFKTKFQYHFSRRKHVLLQ